MSRVDLNWIVYNNNIRIYNSLGCFSSLRCHFIVFCFCWPWSDSNVLLAPEMFFVEFCFWWCCMCKPVVLHQRLGSARGDPCFWWATFFATDAEIFICSVWKQCLGLWIKDLLAKMSALCTTYIPRWVLAESGGGIALVGEHWSVVVFCLQISPNWSLFWRAWAMLLWAVLVACC